MGIYKITFVNLYILYKYITYIVIKYSSNTNKFIQISKDNIEYTLPYKKCLKTQMKRFKRLFKVKF